MHERAITLGGSAASLADFHMVGGTKRQRTDMVPFKDLMQTCMRLSLEVCLGRSCGTIAVPCFEVTTSCGTPPPVGTI